MDLTKLETAMVTAFDALNERHNMLHTQLLHLAQKIARSPGSTDTYGGGADAELADLVLKSDGLAAFLKGNTTKCEVQIPARLLTKNIVNATGADQPLVPSDRVPSRGIVFSPQQRLTIRGLFAAVPTSSNLVERASEATFTSNAGVQGAGDSPTAAEGSLKAQSDATFTIAQTPIVTLAHYVVASRQILSDAALLQAHLSNRLLYFLNLKEETQMLTGDGTAGSMTGIVSSAAAFAGGATNQTRLDTLARAANQLVSSSYEPSSYILNPVDWLACQLEKDTQGRYILGDPGAQVSPSAWGLPVVPTPSMTQGKFVCIDSQRFGYIADREDATVRISENVNDDFVRNLVRMLCEKRTALVTELGGAAVYGSITYAG